MDTNTPIRLDVIGDGSYLALVDARRYVSFVGPNWADDPRLLEPHWIAQMKDQTILVWDTGFETDWRVLVSSGFSSAFGYREVRGTVRLSAGEAFLVNYDSLTMAAQFEDHRLPDESCEANRILAAPGLYEVRIVQMVEPDRYFREPGSLSENRPPEFLVELQPATGQAEPWSSVPWSTLTED